MISTVSHNHRQHSQISGDKKYQHYQYFRQYYFLFRYKQHLQESRSQAVDYLMHLFHQRARETDFIKLAHINDHISQVQHQVEDMDERNIKINKRLWDILELVGEPKEKLVESHRIHKCPSKHSKSKS